MNVFFYRDDVKKDNLSDLLNKKNTWEEEIIPEKDSDAQEEEKISDEK